MASKFFIRKGGKTHGPLSSSDLMKLAQSGKLAPADLVWKEGSNTKVPAKRVKGLSFKSPQVVPTVPVQDNNPSPVKDKIPPVTSDPGNSNEQHEFHYEISGESQGPVSFSELQTLIRQGVVTKDTQVWHDGLEEWTPAIAIDELAPVFPVAKKGSPKLKRSPPPIKAGPTPTPYSSASPTRFGHKTEPVQVPASAPVVVVRQQNEVQKAEGKLYRSHPSMFKNRPVGFIISLLLIPAAGLGLLILLIWWLRVLGTTLTITNKRIIFRKGILSKYTNEVYHSDVRNVQLSQGVFQRMLGVGNVGVSTAGQGDMEIYAAGIPDPQKVKTIIDQNR